jgi:hypothetical protein
MDLTKIKLRDRWPILVEMIDRNVDVPNPLNLQLIDKKKHWEGGYRKGRVVNVMAGVDMLKIGDVVLFEADDGKTLDYDPHTEGVVDESKYRFLKPKECLAVEEPLEVGV